MHLIGNGGGTGAEPQLYVSVNDTVCNYPHTAPITVLYISSHTVGYVEYQLFLTSVYCIRLDTEKVSTFISNVKNKFLSSAFSCTRLEASLIWYGVATIKNIFCFYSALFVIVVFLWCIGHPPWKHWKTEKQDCWGKKLFFGRKYSCYIWTYLYLTPE